MQLFLPWHRAYLYNFEMAMRDRVAGVTLPLVRVRDHQLRAAQAATCQAAQELDPEWLGLTVADRHAEHLAPPVGVDTDATMTATETIWWSRRALT
jgi:hypothetical protein